MSFEKRSLERAAKLPSEKLGAWFEDELKKLFKDLQGHMPCMWHRFTDSKAAGNYVRAQPGDFLLASPTGVYLLEAKASGRYKTLVSGLSNLMKKEQAVPLRLWNRAKQRGFVFFINVPSGAVEIWDGYYVAVHRSRGHKLGTEGRLKVVDGKDLRFALIDLLF